MKQSPGINKVLTFLRKHKILSFILMAILIFLVGLLRDREFYYVNARINYLEGIYGYEAFEGTLPAWVLNLDLNGLVWLKWGMTLVFIILFYAICYLGMVLLLKDYKPMTSVLKSMYIYGTAGALCLYAIDFIIDFNHIGYTSSRFVMHVLQSPLPLFILFPAQFLMKK